MASFLYFFIRGKNILWSINVRFLCSNVPGNYEEQFVVVDSSCGAAVLRGADIFAPGIVTCTETFENDIAAIWVSHDL